MATHYFKGVAQDLKLMPIKWGSFKGKAITTDHLKGELARLKGQPQV